MGARAVAELRRMGLSLAFCGTGLLAGGCGAFFNDITGFGDASPATAAAASIPQPRPVRGWPGGTLSVTKVGQTLFSGQPGEADLAHAAGLGVRTVVNLREKPEMAEVGFDEAAVVESLGMEYVEHPVPPGRGAVDACDTARRYVHVPYEPGSGAPRYLIHDAAGDRVGALWALYVDIEYHRDADAAIRAGRKAGLHSEAMFAELRRALEPN